MPFVRFYKCQRCQVEFTIEKYYHAWPVTCLSCGHEQQHIRTYRKVHEIRQANKAINNHWFDPSTMRFFGTRVGDTVYYGRYFITSEQRETYTERRYSIRIANDNGSIDTVGDFMAYDNYKQAKRALDEHIRTLTEKVSIN